MVPYIINIDGPSQRSVFRDCGAFEGANKIFGKEANKFKKE